MPLDSVKIAALLSPLWIVLAAGCSGTHTELPSVRSGIPFDQLGTRGRYLHDTDKWFYSFDATLTTDTGDQQITGQVQQLLDNAVINGRSYRSLAQIFALSGPGGNSLSSNATYFLQDFDTRVITNYGVNEGGTIRFFATPQQPLLKTGDVGDTGSRITTYSDGTTQEETETVVGTELITVPAGRFMTYKTTGTQKNAARTSYFTNWYSRQLGSFVRSEDNTTLSNGQIVHRRMELISTNVTPEE